MLSSCVNYKCFSWLGNNSWLIKFKELQSYDVKQSCQFSCNSTYRLQSQSSFIGTLHIPINTKLMRLTSFKRKEEGVRAKMFNNSFGFLCLPEYWLNGWGSQNSQSGKQLVLIWLVPRKLLSFSSKLRIANISPIRSVQFSKQTILKCTVRSPIYIYHETSQLRHSNKGVLNFFCLRSFMINPRKITATINVWITSKTRWYQLIC